MACFQVIKNTELTNIQQATGNAAETLLAGYFIVKEFSLMK
jgi:hypothetical protein